MKWILKNWFFLAIFLVVVLGSIIPTPSLSSILMLLIFFYFFWTGVETELPRFSGQSQIKNISAMVLSLLLIPWIGIFCIDVIANVINPQEIFGKMWLDIWIGICCVMLAPLTLASGTIITKIANGDLWFSISMCLLSHLISIFYIPFSFPAAINFGHVDLNINAIAIRLIGTMIIPFLVGQVLRTKIDPIRTFASEVSIKNNFSFFSKILVLLMIYSAVLASKEHLTILKEKILYVFVISLILHLLILCFNYLIGVFVGMDTSAKIALVIHGSQRGLTVSYILSGVGDFANFQLLLIPVAYHITQTIVCLLLAKWIAQKKPGHEKITLCSIRLKNKKGIIVDEFHTLSTKDSLALPIDELKRILIKAKSSDIEIFIHNGYLGIIVKNKYGELSQHSTLSNAELSGGYVRLAKSSAA